MPMGEKAVVELGRGQAALVHTGGMIPDTADAVVQVEQTQIVGGGSARRRPSKWKCSKRWPLGENILQIGEDVALGDRVLPAGHLLRPQDLGGLLALGLTEIAGRRRPRVAILATGDEVVAARRTRRDRGK